MTAPGLLLLPPTYGSIQRGMGEVVDTLDVDEVVDRLLLDVVDSLLDVVDSLLDVVDSLLLDVDGVVDSLPVDVGGVVDSLPLTATDWKSRIIDSSKIAMMAIAF